MRTLPSLFLILLLAMVVQSELVILDSVGQQLRFIEEVRKSNLAARPYAQRRYFPISYPFTNLRPTKKRLNRMTDDKDHVLPEWSMLGWSW
ncbi:hypothetical protein D918_08201 [Trichuris suis]|nr:hypothetical protein D918_08201 [Trichuris suis]